MTSFGWKEGRRQLGVIVFGVFMQPEWGRIESFSGAGHVSEYRANLNHFPVVQLLIKIHVIISLIDIVSTVTCVSHSTVIMRLLI